VPLSVGGWIPIQHNVAWTEAYFRAKWRLDPSNQYTNVTRYTDTQTNRQTDNGPTA